MQISFIEIEISQTEMQILVQVFVFEMRYLNFLINIHVSVCQLEMHFI